MKKRDIATINDRYLWYVGPNTALAMWPPSSWPIGIKFNIVTKIPAHPANATGWRYKEYHSATFTIELAIS